MRIEINVLILRIIYNSTRFKLYYDCQMTFCLALYLDDVYSIKRIITVLTPFLLLT